MAENPGGARSGPPERQPDTHTAAAGNRVNSGRQVDQGQPTGPQTKPAAAAETTKRQRSQRPSRAEASHAQQQWETGSTAGGKSTRDRTLNQAGGSGGGGGDGGSNSEGQRQRQRSRRLLLSLSQIRCSRSGVPFTVVYRCWEHGGQTTTGLRGCMIIAASSSEPPWVVWEKR